MDELLTMSNREITRLEVMQRLKDKRLKQAEAAEKLTEVHQLQLSRESVRRIMIEEGVWKPKRAKQPSAHQMRERRACFGELVQIDGWDHDGFDGRGPERTW